MDQPKESTSTPPDPKLITSVTTRPPRGAFVVFLFFVTFALAVDLTSKWLTFSYEPTKLFDSMFRDEIDERWILVGSVEREKVVIPKILDLKATTNEGAIFGLGQGNRWLFVVVSFFAIAFVLGMFRLGGGNRWDRLLLALLLAGILGNMYDRLVYGYVRDMFFLFPNVAWPGDWQIPLIDYPSADAGRLVFPYIFNVADVCLVCGVSVLMIRTLLFSLGEPVSTNSSPTSSASNAPERSESR
jgi:signal peptidase II